MQVKGAGVFHVNALVLSRLLFRPTTGYSGRIRLGKLQRRTRDGNEPAARVVIVLHCDEDGGRGIGLEEKTLVVVIAIIDEEQRLAQLLLVKILDSVERIFRAQL